MDEDQDCYGKRNAQQQSEDSRVGARGPGILIVKVSLN